MGLHESKDGAAAAVPETPIAVPETPIAMPAMRRLRQLADPRSPSCGIERTPIEVGSNSEVKRRPERLSVGDTGEEDEEVVVTAPKEEGRVAAINDPRSPSQQFDRTPLRLEPENHTQHAASALAMQLDLVFLGLNTSDSAPESDTPRKADARLEEMALRASTAAPPVVPSMREQEPLDPPDAPQAPPPSPSEETPPVPAQCSPLCEAAINVLPELPIYCGSPLKAVSPLRPVLKQRVGPRVLGVHSSVIPRSLLTLVTPRPPLYLVSLCDRNSPGKPQRPAVTGRKGGSGEALHVPARAGHKHERVMGGDKENSAVRVLDD